MTSVCDFYLPDFTLVLSILCNYAEYSKKLMLYYILLLFTILKSLNQMGQPTHLEDEFNLKKRLGL